MPNVIATRPGVLCGQHDVSWSRSTQVRAQTTAACKAGDKMAPKRTRGGCEAALDKYKVGAMLGQGSYALVKSVERKSDGEKFAMKLIDMELSDAGEVEHERKILTLLGQHRHIICLADSFHCLARHDRLRGARRERRHL